MVIASRQAADVPAEVNRLLEALPQHVVPGLDVDAARELLAAQHVALSAEVLIQRVSESAGNPLALIELPVLSESALPVEPLRIGGRLEQAFGRRIAAMPRPHPSGDAAGRGGRRLRGGRPAPRASPAGALPGRPGASRGRWDCWLSERGGLRFRHPARPLGALPVGFGR